jgi:hypothetical protein
MLYERETSCVKIEINPPNSIQNSKTTFDKYFNGKINSARKPRQ